MKVRAFPPAALAVSGLALAAVVSLAPSAAAQGFLVAPSAPAENPVTQEKAILGKILFWDEQLSSDGSISCGTCHIPSQGGSDPRLGPEAIHPGPDGLAGTADDVVGSPGVIGTNAFGHYEPKTGSGLEAQVTGRHSPTNLTAAYFDELFWDGRAGQKFLDPDTGLAVITVGGALETQSLGPFLSDVEMSDTGWTFDNLVTRLSSVRPLALASDLPRDVEGAVAGSRTYANLFELAFGTPKITPVRIAFALATYQRTLIPNQTPWDDFMRGDLSAMTQQQIAGMNAFNTTGVCAVCHTPPLFSNGGYHSLALRPSSEDSGRFSVTGNPADLGRFKTPSLRNVALRGRYFHTGTNTIPTLRASVAFYSGSGAFDNLDPVLNGLVIPDNDIDDMTAFMEALTDPRVAAEVYPFDRPKLRSERVAPNPAPLGTGAAAGTAGETPEVIVAAAPFIGASRFRLGVKNGLGGAFGTVRFRLVSLGALQGASGLAAVRSLLPQRVVPLAGAGPGDGYGTWSSPIPNSPTMKGVSLDAQWWIRDPGASGGVSKSELVRLTVE